MIEQEITITCWVNEKPDVRLIVTSHENTDNSISIHAIGLGASIYITQEQAKDLIHELQEGIFRIELHKRRSQE